MNYKLRIMNYELRITLQRSRVYHNTKSYPVGTYPCICPYRIGLAILIHLRFLSSTSNGFAIHEGVKINN